MKTMIKDGVRKRVKDTTNTHWTRIYQLVADGWQFCPKRENKGEGNVTTETSNI